MELEESLEGASEILHFDLGQNHYAKIVIADRKLIPCRANVYLTQSHLDYLSDMSFEYFYLMTRFNDVDLEKVVNGTYCLDERERMIDYHPGNASLH